MENPNYSLEQILDSITTSTATKTKKRLIFDNAPLGGMGSKFLIGIFILIPFIEYALIFNDYIFNMLGIAEAIVVFIVMLSMVMLLVFTLVVLNNSRVVNKIKPSWNHFFPNIELELVTTTGATPYKEFFNYYHEGIEKDLSGDELYMHLQEKFKIMQEENKDLINAMRKDKERKI